MKTKAVSARDVAKLFSDRGLTKTAQRIVISLENKLPTEQDLADTVSTLRTEMRTYREEYYQDPKFRDDCFLYIWGIVWRAISSNASELNKLTGKLIPVVERMVQTNQVLNDIAEVAEKLEPKPKFYMLCFYFLILIEGSFENVETNLLAMKRLIDRKNVSITETLDLEIDEKTRKAFQATLPNKLNQRFHNHLRNSIAHSNFRYCDKENRIEFWDISPITHEFTLKPVKLTYEEFSKYPLEVYLFCEIFDFIILALIAVEDIAKRHHA
jgi:hypothetical protein